MTKGARIRFLLFGIVALCIVLATSFTGVFWDNVTQIYKLSDWLFSSGLFNFKVPNTFDPGIPLTVPFLHALMWTIFGKHLWVSHLVMWPFVWGLLWQLFRLVDIIFDDKRFVWWVFVLLICDPTLSSMFVLVNYEVVQYFLFFGAINAVLRKQALMKGVFLLFLGVVSLRSMMLCGSVFLFETILFFFVDRKPFRDISFSKHVVPYVVGATPALAFLTWHYTVKGWVFGNSDSPWAECGTLVDFNGFIRNVFVLIHRQVDFGRVFLWITLLWLLFYVRKTIGRDFTKVLMVLALWVSSLALVGVVSLMINNAMGHRYFIASYIAVAILVALLLQQLWGLKKWIFVLLIGLLLLGNLWVYPRKTSQGWDASLAHLPYWHLRHDMLRYMDTQGISVDETASFFPNECAIGAVDINGDGRSFISFDGSHKYVFYSNVYNLSDEGYDLLDQKYAVVREISFFPVKIILYRLKE
jgi:hypothetical protein